MNTFFMIWIHQHMMGLTSLSLLNYYMSCHLKLCCKLLLTTREVCFFLLLSAIRVDGHLTRVYFLHWSGAFIDIPWSLFLWVLQSRCSSLTGYSIQQISSLICYTTSKCWTQNCTVVMTLHFLLYFWQMFLTRHHAKSRFCCLSFSVKNS